MRLCHQCGAFCNQPTCQECSAELVDDQGRSRDPLVGRRLGEDYELQELIGFGGMGRVYQAEQRALGRAVAVKVLHPELVHDERSVERFYTEARTTSLLNHPNTVGIIDFGRTDDGFTYLVMEHIDGADLATLIPQGAFPHDRICGVVGSILAALSEAHALSIVHRDLKPENVIVRHDRSGRDLVKVVDFGLATIANSGGGPSTVAGTPEYMSPEQSLGAELDGRSDLYAVGVMLFELLADRLPFEADSAEQVIALHRNQPVPDPRVCAPYRAVPDDLARVAMRALEKDPADRFQTAEEFEAAVAACREALKDRSRASVVGMSTLAPPGAAHPPTVTPGTLGPEVFIARDRELSVMDDIRHRALGAATWLHVAGELGAGKTTLLRVAAGRARADGDTVVQIAPAPSQALIPFRLLGDIADGLGAERWRAAARPELRFWLDVVGGAVPLDGSLAADCATELTRAMQELLHAAAECSLSGRVVLVIDDYAMADSLSRRVLEAVYGSGALLSTALVTSAEDRFERPSVINAQLESFNYETATLMLAAMGHLDPVLLGSIPKDAFVTPLYLLRAALLSTRLGGPDPVPARLAELVTPILDELSMGSRRLVQAAAVLGTRCKTWWIKSLVGEIGDASFHPLLRHGLVHFEGDELVFDHPYLRDLIAGTIPASVRRQLHGRAFALAIALGQPLEVRAEHAFRGLDADAALISIEQAANRASRLGEHGGAVLQLGRAVDLCRREALHSGEERWSNAWAVFSRKFGASLAVAGESSQAEGVLREALQFIPPASEERSRVLVTLGETTALRGRTGDARYCYEQALSHATQHGHTSVLANAHASLGRLELSAGAPVEAERHLREALDIERMNRADELRIGQLMLELASVPTEAGADLRVQLLDGALSRLRASAPTLAMEVLAQRGALNLSIGRGGAARADFEAAANLASELGDFSARDRYRVAAEGCPTVAGS